MTCLKIQFISISILFCFQLHTILDNMLNQAMIIANEFMDVLFI
jgi:hypothetical protein